MENIPKLDLGDTEDSPPRAEKPPNESARVGSLLLTSRHRRAHYVLCEYEALAKNPIEGVYITMSSTDPLVWFGLLIVRAGVFYGGIFRFTLTLPADFPDTKQLPTVKFQEKLFHPLISPATNEVDLGRFFPSGWQKDRNHVYQVLSATQGMFFSCKCEAGQAANPEAAMLWKSDKEKFKQLANEAVKQSRTQVYAPPESEDPRAINFTPWNHEDMEPVRKALLGQTGEGLPDVGAMISGSKRRKGGYSWIDPEKAYYMCDLLPRKSSIDQGPPPSERRDSIVSVPCDSSSEEISGRSTESS